MPLTKHYNHVRKNWLRLCGCLLFWLVTGCKVIKNYPSPEPFVYKTTIKLDAKLPSSERASLISKMETQVADSLQVRYSKKGFFEKTIGEIEKKPENK